MVLLHLHQGGYRPIAEMKFDAVDWDQSPISFPKTPASIMFPVPFFLSLGNRFAKAHDKLPSGRRNISKPMDLLRSILLIILISSISACSSQPLSPEDELAMELYRACMEGASSTWGAQDVSAAASGTAVNTAGSINTTAQGIRKSRDERDCQNLVRERSSD